MLLCKLEVADLLALDRQIEQEEGALRVRASPFIGGFIVIRLLYRGPLTGPALKKINDVIIGDNDKMNKYFWNREKQLAGVFVVVLELV